MRFALLVALASAACAPEVTETLVTVSSSGLQLGVDVNQLHLSAVDTTVNYTGFDRTLRLCDPPGSDCQALPLSVLLYPGSRREDSVRVLVEGLRDSTVVISNAAIVTFVAGVRARLDIVLYGACLGHVDCSALDQSCGADGRCTRVDPMGGPDLAVPDMATADDMPFTVCGAQGMACCSNSECNTANLACVAGKCLPCGGSSQWCCPSLTPCMAGLGCDYQFHCSSQCGFVSGFCCANESCFASGCSFGRCLTGGCGMLGGGCCAGSLCADGLSCVNNQCVTDACATGGTACCTTTSPAHCAAGLVCDPQGNCHACGRYGQQACAGANPCWPGLQPDPFAGLCKCDAPGEYCCGGTTGICFGDAQCVGGTCQ